ncbi:M3 family metallopeptidase [Candidatus Dependentiae bacterium]
MKSSIVFLIVMMHLPVLGWQMTDPISNVDNVRRLFSLTPKEIEKRTASATKEIRTIIDKIAAISPKDRTFENTILPIDRASNFSNAYVLFQVLQVLKDLSPDDEVRKVAAESLLKINSILSIPIIGPGQLSSDVAVYRAFREYVEGNGKTEILNDEHKRYLDSLDNVFKQSGFSLTEDQRKQFLALKKEIDELSQQFSRNITDETSFCEIDPKELPGVDTDFIDSLEKTPDGCCLVDVGHWSSYSCLMRSCTKEETRKKLWLAYCSRAYPANDHVFRQIMAKSDQLAKLLGYQSFAHLSLDGQMIGSPQDVTSFFDQFIPKSIEKRKEEFATLTEELPEGVMLTEDGKMKPWDRRYAGKFYGEKNRGFDSAIIDDYFPLKVAIDGLFCLCKDLFGLKLEFVKNCDAWHEDVELVRVSSLETGELIGHILLDSYTRPNKFAARCYNIIPALQNKDERTPALAVIVLNFAKPTGKKPVLLSCWQVSARLFHEFGHALHHLLGATQLASFAGMNVIFDFLEMPSRTLERLGEDLDFLKKISKHYKTGEQLPDEIIEKIKSSPTFSGGNLLHKALFSLEGLFFYLEGAGKDPAAIHKKLSATLQPHIMQVDADYSYASCFHYTIYGPRCYCYTWANLLAYDVADFILSEQKKDPDVGKRYVEQVLSKGGSKDPNVLMREFLGREPNDKAFCKAVELI